LLEELSPSVAVRLSPRDAQELGVVGGQAVRLVQDGTEVLLRARLDRRVPQGVVAAPWVSRGDGASRLIKGDGEVVTVELRRS
jgi:anaerobic selenocysteine-containing dehydrogenase